MPLFNWVHDPIILGSDQPSFQGDPLKMGSLPKIQGSWTHLFRVRSRLQGLLASPSARHPPYLRRAKNPQPRRLKARLMKMAPDILDSLSASDGSCFDEFSRGFVAGIALFFGLPSEWPS